MKTVIFKGRQVRILDIEGIDTKDYPDFVDAFISGAYYIDTDKNLTDSELDELAEQNTDIVHELVMEIVF